MRSSSVERRLGRDLDRLERRTHTGIGESLLCPLRLSIDQGRSDATGSLDLERDLALVAHPIYRPDSDAAPGPAFTGGLSCRA
jgi:hypothetical protein